MRMSPGEQDRRGARRLRDLLDTDFDHLSTEAIAAYVDHELTPGAFHRANCHLENCDRCRREVSAQEEAAGRLRAAGTTTLQVSAALLQRLASIPDAVDQMANSEGDERVHAAGRGRINENPAYALSVRLAEFSETLRERWTGK